MILEEVINVSEELRQIRIRLKKTEKEMEHLSETADNVDSIVEEHGRPIDAVLR